MNANMPVIALTALAIATSACTKRNFNAQSKKQPEQQTEGKLPGSVVTSNEAVSQQKSDFTVRLVHTSELDESTVVLFDTYGWRLSPTTVRAKVHAWIHDNEESPILQGLLQFGMSAYISGPVTRTTTPEAKSIFTERSRNFFYESQSKKSPILALGQKNYQAPPSGENGHTEGFVDGESLILATSTGNSTSEPQSYTQATAYVLDHEGTSLISDIDDTIKKSDVAVQENMLFNTFYQPFSPIEGMAEAYQRLATKEIFFHYVSNSPWQLYPTIHSFIKQAGFPPGTLHLANFRLKDRSSFQYLFGRDDIKTANIETILSDFPERKFILVGDTGERDPEVYASIAKRHPNMIVKILLRTAPSATEHPADRVAQACSGLPEGLCQEFSDPLNIQM